jgi:hypothetical protein
MTPEQLKEKAEERDLAIKERNELQQRIAELEGNTDKKDK